MRYIVLSYGRPDLQITLQSLPEKLLKHVELFVVPSEYKQYKKGWYASKVKKIECWPDHIDCAPKKRKWAAQNINEDYALFDDDVNLYVWSNKQSKYVKPEVLPKKFEREFLEEWPSLYSEYAGLSLATKFMADPFVREHGLIKENTVGFVVSGFRKGLAKNIQFNRTFAFTDIALPLQVFQNTKKSAIYYGLCYNHSAVKGLETTGMSSYRSDFVKMDSALKMAQLFPGIVTGAKETGNKGGGVTLQKFFSRVISGVTEGHRAKSQEYIDSVCKEHGLRKPPKIFEYDDYMPRQEIIHEFKRNWNRVKIK